MKKEEKSATWITVREAAERTGRRESTIRVWRQSARVRSRKVDGRVQLRAEDVARVAAETSAKPQGRKPGKSKGKSKLQKRGPGRPKQPRIAEEEITLAEFATRAGLSQRTVQLKRQRGEIDRYTEADLERLLSGRGGGDDKASKLDPATASDDDLRDASEAELKRVKLYHEARMAKLKADREEGKVYEAEAVEGVVRRLAHLARTTWQQAPMMLPQELAGKDAAEIRGILARYAQQQIEALANVADSDLR